MSDKQIVLAIFPDEVTADTAVEALKAWGKAVDEKLDAVGVLVLDKNGKVKGHKLGKHTGGKGAGIGLVLAMATPVGLAAGIVAGGALGAMHTKGLGLTDGNREELGLALSDGKAAVGVLVEPHEADVVYAKLTELGGTVKLLPLSEAIMAEAAMIYPSRAAGDSEAVAAQPEAADRARSGVNGSGSSFHPMNVSAVVLAGGRSSRFGRDKLAEPIDGAPVLSRTIAAVHGVATDIVVVTGPDATVKVPSGVRIARDPSEYGGPLVGVLGGLATARHEAVLVVGGDMPWLRPEVLTLMLEALVPGKGAVALEFGGRLQQLPIALRRAAGLQAARGLTDAGERRLGTLLEALDVVGISEATWRVMDPDGATVRDVDTPADLSAPG